MVPQMNENRLDTNDNVQTMRREQLIEQCLQLGMPVAGDEDEETLEMYVKMVNDDDFDDLGLNENDSYEERKTNVDSSKTKTGVLGKLISLFM
jgi:hypothetical protein